MSSQRTIFLLGKDKLINLKLTVLFSYLEAGRLFRNWKINLSKIIGIDWFHLLPRIDNIFALSWREPKMSRKIP